MMNLLPFIHVSGVSTPLFSLRYENDFGIGDVRGAYVFVDFLSLSGQGLWKILPITETSSLSHNSPYDPLSSFALDPVYIDISILEDLPMDEYAPYLEKNRVHLHQGVTVDYARVRAFKDEILRNAFRAFLENEYELSTPRAKEFQDYCNAEHEWLDSFALFKELLVSFSYTPLSLWPEDVRRKEKKTIEAYRHSLAEEISFHKYVQWIIQTQWNDVRAYANARNVYIMGDIPFYTGLNSADVWTNPHHFYVNPDLSPLAYGGAPPDIYSEDGQKWEVAVSNWDAMKKDGYDWWMRRIERCAGLFDGIRLDHFRGFFGYWYIPAGKRGKDGQWRDGPGMQFLQQLISVAQRGHLCTICVENLGLITQDVEDGRYALGLPGYTLFYESFRYILNGALDPNSNCQTTTHDSLPLLSWWKVLPASEKEWILSRLDIEATEERMRTMDDTLRWAILEKVYSLPYVMKLVPLQDILGTEERINIPGTKKDNWVYRMSMNCEDLLGDKDLARKLDGYARNYSLNMYDRDVVVRSFPVLSSHIHLTYNVGDELPVWLYTGNEEKQPILVVEQKEGDEVIYKEINCQLQAQSNQGTLYRGNVRFTHKGIARIYQQDVQDESNSLIIHVGE